EGLTDHALWRRSNWLSSLAGWPGKLDPEAVAAHEAAVRAARAEANHIRHVTGMVVPSIDLLRVVETCEYRRIPECGCAGMDCVRDRRRVTLDDCLKCKGV